MENPLLIPKKLSCSSTRELKDHSLALFMGTQLDTKYQDDLEALRNNKIIQFFSKHIAQVNKQFFREKLETGLDEELRSQIIELDDQDEPFVDSYGRATYFVARLGGQVMPVY
jgi:hypothetical protein